MLVEQEQRMSAIETKRLETDVRIDDLESKFEAKLNPTVRMNWYTVTGYIGLMKYRVNPKDYSSLGKLAAKLSKEKGYPMGSAPHPTYGSIHTYHTDILEEVFEQYWKCKRK